MDAHLFLTHSLRDARLTRILSTALEAVDPASLVRHHLVNMTLPAPERVFLLALGKAAQPMAEAAADTLGDPAATLVITKHALASGRAKISVEADLEPPTRFTVLEAGHPVPDHRSLLAGLAVEAFVSRLQPDDLLLCLLSGGASSLVIAPPRGVSLTDLQSMTASMLASGGTIDEINVLRRSLDRLKGGGLAAATHATIISLILSDVIGDRLETIGSGPTVPNPTTNRDAIAVLQKYAIQPPVSIAKALQQPAPFAGVSRYRHVRNFVIGNNSMAVEAARKQAEYDGFSAHVLGSSLCGEARSVSRDLVDTLLSALRNRPRPFCLVGGGETTVTLDRHGRGGRNQEVALAAVDALSGQPNIVFLSLATDGNDGPTDAAGAVVTGDTRFRAQQLGMLAADYLSAHDAYPFFDALGDLLKPGYTGTNVNDLTLLAAL